MKTLDHAPKFDPIFAFLFLNPIRIAGSLLIRLPFFIPQIS